MFKKIGFINLLIIFFFFIIILLYLINLTQDVYAGDIGDIATAAAVFGVAHPPGYPTLTLLGFIFSKIPLPLPVISKIAFVSTVASVSGLIIYFKFVLTAFSTIKQKEKRIGTEKIIAALLSTGILGFSYYYWLYAEVPEVFALNNLFLISLFFAGYLFYKTKKFKYLYLTLLLAGLSMTNQQAVMFVFPGIAIFILPELLKMLITTSKEKRTINKAGLGEFLKVFKNMIFVFLIGLSPYLYVFISALTKPQINWMKEPTIYNFLRLILRMDYKFGENLVDISQRIVVQGIYFSTLINTFSLVLSLIGVLGGAYLYIKDKRFFTALITGFIFAGPLFIFIITPEIIDPDELGIVERMFMHSFVLFSFFIPFGFLAMQNFFYKFLPRRIYGVLFLIPFIIVLLQMVYYNFPKTDLSETKIGSNFAKDILDPLPRNSVVFLLGDIGTLNTWFVHYIEGHRPDIILAGSFGDRNDFESQIYEDFKRKNKSSTLTIEQAVIKQLPEILNKRKVYSMFQFPLYSKDYMWVPRGLVFELMPIKDIPDSDIYLTQTRNYIKSYKIAYRDDLLPSEQNNIAPYMSKQYSNAFNHIGDFLYVRYGQLQSAYSYYQRAQIIDPQNPLSYAKLGIIQAEYPAQCNLAVENIDTSIEMYKIYRPYYTFALRIYKKCKVSEIKINDLKGRYKKLFTKDLEKDVHY